MKYITVDKIARKHGYGISNIRRQCTEGGLSVVNETVSVLRLWAYLQVRAVKKKTFKRSFAWKGCAA